MKNLFLAIIAVTITSFSLNAQVLLMPKVGVSLANYNQSGDLDDWYDTKPSARIMAGVAVDIPLNGSLSLQPEFLFVQKGTPQENTLEVADDFLDLGDGFVVPLYVDYNKEQLSYIETPLLVKYSFLGTSFGFHIMAGPTIGIGIGGKYSYTVIDNQRDERFSPSDPTYNELYAIDDSYDVEWGSASDDFYKPLDIGVTFGGGLYIPIGNGRINIDARYQLGLTNMYISDNYSQKNTALQLSIGYGMPISTIN